MASYTPSTAFVSAENSTTVRTSDRSAAVAPWPLRASLAAAEALAPRLAARLGERLFLTPPRHAQPAVERDALARGRELTVRAAGERLRAWRFGSTGPTVLLVHGWGGRAGQLAPFFEPLEDQGLSVVTFDAPAHGGSSGRLASAPVFAEAVADVARQVEARAAVAHSIGGAGLALALASGLELDAAVLVAPPRGPLEFFHRFAEALQLRPRTVQAVRDRVERRYGIPLEGYDLPRHLAAVTTPVLVVHDRGDREVPWSDGEAVAGALPGAELVSTTGLGHRRILREPAIVDRAVEFLLARLQRCASCDRRAVHGRGDEARCASCALAAELADVRRRWPSPDDPFAGRDVALGRSSTLRVLQSLAGVR
jgi:pimeloyl-ACP methyl ester carboxylesterase